MSVRMALLHSRVRVEEKLLFEALVARGCRVELIDVRDVVLNPADASPWSRFDLIVDRCIAHSQTTAVIPLLESMGLRCVNRSDVTRVCGNKLETSLALLRHHVPTLPVRVAVSASAALEAIESIGYPVVLKPVVGSWGRLLAKINDRDAAEALVEHKEILGSTTHQVFYVQPYVEKNQFDIRAFVIGNETICAIRRHSPHWITNTARGARTECYPLSPSLQNLCQQAAAAVGGGALAIDLFELTDGQLLVNEINSTMEYRNSIAVTGVDIPARLAEYLQRMACGDIDDVPPTPTQPQKLSP